MAWRIVKGPEDVTYPPSKPGVSWRYTLQSGDGREMTVTFDFAEISPDPATVPGQQPRHPPRRVAPAVPRVRGLGWAPGTGYAADPSPAYPAPHPGARLILCEREVD